jgi:putative protease
VELLDEPPEAVEGIVAAYRDLIAGKCTGRDVWTRLRAVNRVGVTRGTLDAI